MTDLGGVIHIASLFTARPPRPSGREEGGEGPSEPCECPRVGGLHSGSPS